MFVSLLALGALASPGPPNIVLIVADDLGYGDVGCYGAPDIRTPNIDALAARGVRMTDGYATAPVCGPSRAGMLTGRYQQRYGFEYNFDKDVAAVTDIGLPKSEPIFPLFLKKSGYSTGMVGKWHLGMRPGFLPNGRGFEYFFGFYPGASAYIPGGTATWAPIYLNTKRVTVEKYLTEEFTDRAVEYINTHASQPFCLYLAYNAPHWPLQTTAKYRSRYPNLSGKRQTLAAMISAMDDGIGAVRKALADNNLTSNTLIVFVSDNGGTFNSEASNLPLSGEKGMVFEGGIRVPFVMSWPAAIPQGIVYDRPVSTLDIMPTVLTAANVPIKPWWELEGTDLMPFLLGFRAEDPHRRLFWRYGEQRAVRSDNWKYFRWLDETVYRRRTVDLSTDLQETKNLEQLYPEVSKSLINEWHQWNASNIDPMWPNPMP